VAAVSTQRRIADGIAALLTPLGDFGLRAVVWMPDRLAADSVTAVVGFPERIEYDQTMGRGMVKWSVPVTLYAGREHSQQAQEALAAFTDPYDAASVKAAIEADPTLGGAADACVIALADRFGAYEINGSPYLGYTLNVEVWTSG
jgi:hypothetical protein